MKLLLAFVPFHPPTSAPFGLACLKAALQRKSSGISVYTMDWNLAFFRRWLLQETPHLCDWDPDHLLHRLCPHLLVEEGHGRRLWEALTHLPRSHQERIQYMEGVRRLDFIFSVLAAFYHRLLRPYVEDRAKLAPEFLETLFFYELSEISKEQPDIVGFSILAEQNLIYAVALGRVVKEKLGIPIALGGSLMSHLDPEEILRAFPWIDLVFQREGEDSVSLFVDAWPLSDHRALESVPAITHRDPQGRICVHSPADPPCLLHLPFPDFSGFPLREYLAPEPVLPIQTSRGCYWGKCTFCSHTLPYGKGVRHRPLVQVVDEMAEQQERHGVRSFLFVDEAISPQRLRELARAIQDRGLRVLWGAEGIRPEEAFHEPLLEEAYEAGLRWIYVGMESTLPRTVERMRKGTSTESAFRLIGACQKAGITPQLSYIIGFPGTTEEDLRAEEETFREFALDASPFVLLKGSPMAWEPERFGIRIEEPEVLLHTTRGRVHAPRLHFTTNEGLSPLQAHERLKRRIGASRRRMRPHLGEIHAVLLADTDFFQDEERPPETDLLGELLDRLLDPARNDPRRALHVAGTLEVYGKPEKALHWILKRLEEEELHPLMREKLWVHLAALWNTTGRPEDVLHLVKMTLEDCSSARSALLGQAFRALVHRGRAAEVIQTGLELFAAGYEIEGFHYLMGWAYERMGRPQEALDAYREAELRYWNEPEINRAQARCLLVLGRHRAAREMEAKARRKEANL
jgi:radical SAM superfamily enzyme YgiQ (UPF0313 family)